MAPRIDNELVLLDQVLLERQNERPIPLKDDDAFEIFACEQVLRDRDLSADEVASGVVGGGNDGAIDGVYVFLGDTQLSEDSDIFQDTFISNKVPSGTRLSLWLVQAKRERSFTETAIDKVMASTRRLLDLREADDDLMQLYSPEVVERTGLFRNAWQKLARRHPDIDIRFLYVTRGRTDEINTKVVIKAGDLERQFREVVTGASGSVEFFGAAELWKRANAIPSYTKELIFQENATSGTSHVALVKLRDYITFLTDDQGDLQRHIFDLNVRDFAGDVEVNKEIRSSLEDPNAPEFWWLNNGITIVCSKASIVAKKYALDDVQIVNGLQTSHMVYRHLHDAPETHPALDRSVLVRILVTGDDPAVRDQVIRATNRQTSVPAASLRATDEIQRKIETFFSQHDWFYDRRKNFYRNIGKSPEKIIGIPFLAQAVMAMGLSRPDDSRARPSSLLKRDEDYKKIFSKDIPLPVYLWLATAQKSVDGFLASDVAHATVQERTNLRFHLAMTAAAFLVGGQVRNPAQLAAIAETKTIEDADLKSCLSILRESFAEYAKKTKYGPDRIAKGSEFVEFLLARLFPPKRRGTPLESS